jgi:hypothetical protein
MHVSSRKIMQKKFSNFSKSITQQLLVFEEPRDKEQTKNKQWVAIKMK